MGASHTYWLLPVAPDATISTSRWDSAQTLLLEMQPATSVALVGQPPHAILIEGPGDPVEIAPAILRHVEDCVGTLLRLSTEPPPSR